MYPVMLKLEGKEIAVVGGGEVALRKVKTLLQYEAKIKVISPEFTLGFEELQGQVELIKDYYREELISSAFLCIAATASREVNTEIAMYCKANRILCNVVDSPELSDFFVPSTVKRGSLIISVSTSGKSPALAARIRKELDEKYPKFYEEYLDILGDIRDLIKENCEDEALRSKLLRDILDLSLEELIEWRKSYEGSCRLQGK